MTTISDGYALPCGLTLKNRIAKAAMTEQLAGPDLLPNEGHENLYRTWAAGGAGLLITGNVQVDRRHLEHPGNIAFDETTGTEQMPRLRRWADAAQSGGARALVQISHAGRQTPRVVNPEPFAPSAVGLALPGRTFGTPKEMPGEEIRRTEDAFVRAATIAAEAGFSGVQVHAAHGYLLSSFLNPRANVRTDGYGGSLENRARLLLRIVERIRQEAPEGFAVSVKLNSSDFQKGGLSTDDSLTVCGWLAERGVDLLEVSGGNYEQPAMMDIAGMEKRQEQKKAESTRKREAYFLVFAEEIRKKSSLPLMVTGGFRTLEGMNAALESGATDLVGLARPLCVRPALPKELLSGEADRVRSYEKELRIGPGIFGPQSSLKLMKALNGFSVMAFFYENIDRLSRNEPATERMRILPAFIRRQKDATSKAKALS